MENFIGFSPEELKSLDGAVIMTKDIKEACEFIGQMFRTGPTRENTLHTAAEETREEERAERVVVNTGMSAQIVEFKP